MDTPRIHIGKIPPLIKPFLDRLSRNPHLSTMVSTAEKDIAKAEGLLEYWKDVERIATQKQDHMNIQISNLWISNTSLTIQTTIHMLAIQDLILQVDFLTSPELDAARRKAVREEIKSVFNEVKTISEGLKQPEKPLDPRILQ